MIGERILAGAFLVACSLLVIGIEMAITMVGYKLLFDFGIVKSNNFFSPKIIILGFLAGNGLLITISAILYFLGGLVI